LPIGEIGGSKRNEKSTAGAQAEGAEPREPAIFREAREGGRP
jgi:hypothetical protein